MRQRTPLLPIEASALTESIQCHLEAAYIAAQQLSDACAPHDRLVPMLEHLMLRLAMAEVRLSMVAAEVRSRP